MQAERAFFAGICGERGAVRTLLPLLDITPITVHGLDTGVWEEESGG